MMLFNTTYNNQDYVRENVLVVEKNYYEIRETMIILYKIAITISSLAFLFYGFNCLYSNDMRHEFKRFGLTDGQRKFTGILQLAGGLGLALGYFTSIYILLFAAIGLCLLMIMGFGVRLKVKDNIPQSLPSLIFAIANAYISFVILNKILV
ncbi:MAG: DoxX family protein [Maribacter sp.]